MRPPGGRTYVASMMATYGVVRDHVGTFRWLAAMVVSSGSLALFAMYLPPLFPTLLRTTVAGFCFNIGRIPAAAGTVFFGLFSEVGDYRLAHPGCGHGVPARGAPRPPAARIP